VMYTIPERTCERHGVSCDYVNKANEILGL